MLVEQVKRLYVSTKKHMPLVELDVPKERLIIVGDIHGHLNDLLHIFNTYGEPSETNVFVFNGDFVDRGVWGPEVLLALLCLKLWKPDHMHLNRGNHESEMCTEFYGFKSHLAEAYPQIHEQLYKGVHDVFNQLPLCFVVGGKIAVVHGGLPAHNVMLKDIKELPPGPVPLLAK